MMSRKKAVASSTLSDGKIPGLPPDGDDVNRMFAKIGRVASAFGSLELMLDEYLVELINASTDSVGHVVLNKMNSFAMKLHLFKKLVLVRLGLPHPSVELQTLCKRTLAAACARRNDIVHSTYQGISGERDKLHQRWPQGRSRNKIVKGEKKAIDYGAYTITEDEIDNVVDQIEEAEFSLLTFMTETVYQVPHP